MKKNKIIAGTITFCVLGCMGFSTASAATLPPLGAAASFSVLGQTLITGISTISGDVGMNNSGANITALTTPNVAGTIYATDLVAPSEGILLPAVQADASAEFNVGIPGQGTNGTIVGNLDGQTFTPGVYDQGAIVLAGGTVTLDGAGIYIFRSASDLTSAGTINLINGARACDVFWRVQTAAAINGTSFKGTILAGAGIHFGVGVALDGRALAIGADVTLANGGTISGPSCAVPPPVPDTSTGGVYSIPWITPVIDVVKSATPTFLPAGPGAVVYDYIVSNIGTTAINTVTVTDDKCSHVAYLSGDINNDSILDRTENWKYRCTSTIAVTTTNIVTATGRAFFYTTTDTASATVVVGTTTVAVIATTTPPIVWVAPTSTVITYPSLPNAGIAPNDNTTSSTSIVILASIFGVALAFINRKQIVRLINLR